MTFRGNLKLVSGFAGVLTAILVVCPAYSAPSYTVPVLNEAAANSGLASLPSTVYNDVTGRATETVRTNSNAILNWSSFDVSGNAGIDFQQPSAGSIVLNRISGSASQIFGSVSSNGKIILVNQNGINFASGSTVNVAGLLATTSDISDADFNNNNFRFDGTGYVTIGSGSPAINNDGTIKTIQDGGLVALVAPTVTNGGTIEATAGTVVLASGNSYTIDLYGDGMIQFAADPALSAQLVQNSGAINASGGKVLMTASAAADAADSLINMDGIVQADAVVDVDGKVVLEAGSVQMNAGTVVVSGSVSAANAGDAVGSAGLNGGEVRIEGKSVAVGSGASVDVSSKKGNAGNVALVGSELVFAGDVNAAGGQNGGFVHMQGDDRLLVTGNVNASGFGGGANGVWSLSSTYMVIADVDYFSYEGEGGVFFLDGSYVSASSLGNALGNGTDVEASASNGSIAVLSSVVKIGDRHSSFNLNSVGDISVDWGVFVSSSGSSMDVEFNAGNDGGSITIGEISSIASNGGDVTFGSGAVAMSSGSSIYTNGGNISIDGAIGNEANFVGVRLDNATLNAAGGDVSVIGRGYEDGADGSRGVSLENGSVVETSGNGSVFMEGYGAGFGSDNSGVLLSGGSSVHSDFGAITLNGVGGGNTGGYEASYNDGVAVVEGSMVYSGNGSVSISGTGGGWFSDWTYFNNGVLIADGSWVYAGDGSVSLSGIGGGNGAVNASNNYGVLVDNEASVESFTSGLNEAGIVAFGAGGGNSSGVSDSNSGVAVSGGSSLYAEGGNIDIYGIGGGNESEASYSNSGVAVDTGSSIGVNLFDRMSDGIIARGFAGSISVMGMGGGNDTLYGGFDNQGVYLGEGASIESGFGNIEVSGQGGGNYAVYNSYGNSGVYLSEADISSVAGNVTVSGMGGGMMGDSEVVVPMFYEGEGGYGDGEGQFYAGDNHGVFSLNGSHVGSEEGDVLISGVAGVGMYGDSWGIASYNLTEFGSDNAIGRITFETDTISFDDTVYAQTAGNVTFIPYTASTDISVGDNYDYSSTLQITGTILSNMIASSITVGKMDDTGLINVGDFDNWTSSVQSVSLLNGSGDIVFRGAMVMGDRQLLAHTAYGNIAIGSSGSISSDRAYGTAVTLAASEGAFSNYGVSGNLSAGEGGRWLVYSGGPMTNFYGDLVSDFRRYSCVYDGTCPVSIPDSGNGFIYSVTPTLELTLNDHTSTYGQSVDPLALSSFSESYDFHGVTYYMDDANMDSSDTRYMVNNIATGTSSVLDASTRLNAGDYSVWAENAVAAEVGYVFNVDPATSSLVVNPAALSVAAYSYFVPMGGTIPSPLKYAVVGGLQYEDAETDVNFSGALTTTAPGTAVSGDYDVTVGSLAASGNYVIGDFTNGVLTVGEGGVDVPDSVIEYRPSVPQNNRTFNGLLLAIAGGGEGLGDMAPQAGGDDDELSDLNPEAGGGDGSTPLIQCNEATPCDLIQ